MPLEVFSTVPDPPLPEVVTGALDYVTEAATPEVEEEDEVETFECDWCNQDFALEGNDSVTLANEDIVCQECFNNSGTSCYNCALSYHIEETRYMENLDRTVCEGCFDDRYFRCEECENYYTHSRMAETDDARTLCTDCNTSEDPEEDSDEEEEDGSLRNRNPNASRGDSANFVNSYNFDATTVLPFLGHDKSVNRMSELYMGVELEVEVVEGRKEDAAIETIKLLDDKFVCLKHDGSITYGFEIVTAPSSFDVHKEKWAKFFDERIKNRATKHLRSYDTTTCGMHIHLSRAAMTPLQISKMLVFINDPDNKEFIETIAQRKEGQWSHYFPKKLTQSHNITRDQLFEEVTSCPSCGSAEKFTCVNGAWICDAVGCCAYALVKPVLDSSGKPIVKLQLKGTHPTMEDKYQSLNLKHKATIEMRIFKGTLNRASFMKNLEFAHALVTYCRNASINSGSKVTATAKASTSKDLKVDPFVRWLATQSKTYPNLFGFLQSKNILKTPVKLTKRYPKGKTNNHVFNNSEAI
jgi:hypothetical protein